MERRDRDEGISIGKVRLSETHRGSVLEGIPSDDTSNISMTIQWAFGDAFIGMISNDLDKFIYLPPMRFRAYAGGSNLPMISNELSGLPQSFKDNSGVELEVPQRFDDRIKGFDPMSFVKGEEDDDFTLSIRDITEDDEVIGEWTKFMDIDLLKNDDVRVTMRNTDYESSATMVFKTKEHNGQFPVMATVFKRIVDVLEKAKV
jgi:hypothetical protein